MPYRLRSTRPSAQNGQSLPALRSSQLFGHVLNSSSLRSVVGLQCASCLPKQCIEMIGPVTSRCWRGLVPPNPGCGVEEKRRNPAGSHLAYKGNCTINNTDDLGPVL